MTIKDHHEYGDPIAYSICQAPSEDLAYLVFLKNSDDFFHELVTLIIQEILHNLERLKSRYEKFKIETYSFHKLQIIRSEFEFEHHTFVKPIWDAVVKKWSNQTQPTSPPISPRSNTFQPISTSKTLQNTPQLNTQNLPPPLPPDENIAPTNHEICRDSKSPLTRRSRSNTLTRPTRRSRSNTTENQKHNLGTIISMVVEELLGFKIHSSTFDMNWDSSSWGINDFNDANTYQMMSYQNRDELIRKIFMTFGHDRLKNLIIQSERGFETIEISEIKDHYRTNAFSFAKIH